MVIIDRVALSFFFFNVFFWGLRRQIDTSSTGYTSLGGKKMVHTQKKRLLTKMKAQDR